MLGQVVGVGDHQVAAVETGGEHKRDGADPLHDCVGLWSHLGNNYRVRVIIANNSRLNIPADAS